MLRLEADGPIFRANGSPFRVKSVSGFNLIDQYSKGKDINPFLDKYNRSNRVRVFTYTPEKFWGVSSWGFPSKVVVKEFIEYLITKGKATSLCLITDDDQDKLQQARDLVNYLNEFNFPGLFLEEINEPLTHDKLASGVLKNTLNGSRYLYGSGIYEDLKKFWGKVGYIHTPRDNEWPRKAKDAIEAYRGGGPNSTDEPACKVPWILDEPIRPDQAGFNTLDFYAYGALGSLTSAGITFHSESGKLGKLPSDEEFSCYQALMDGMNVFSESAPLGKYDHLRDLEEVDADNKPTTCLRVFQVGHYVVVVRPKSVKIPSNWKSLDNYRICYQIQ